MVIAFLLWGCSSEKSDYVGETWNKQNATEFVDSLKFKSVGIFSIPSDSNVSLARVSDFHSFSDQNTDYIYYYYVRTNSIYLHSVHSNYKKQIRFQEEGPKALVAHPRNIVYALSKDAFLIFERSTKSLKMYKDGSLQYLGSLPSVDQILEEKHDFGFHDYTAAYKDEIEILDSVVYISLTQHNPELILEGYKPINNILTFDLKIGEFGSFLPLPDHYYGAFWGKGGSIKAHVFMSESADGLVFGFTGQNGIHFKQNSEIPFRYIGSKFFNRIEPAPAELKKRPKEASWDWMSTTPFYEDIVYNEKSGNFYRFAFHGNSMDAVKKRYNDTNESVIIFDKTGRKLGEVLFENALSKYDFYKTFVIDGELYILRKDLYHNKSDAFFYFEKFEESPK
jgi:hypothetical protein